MLLYIIKMLLKLVLLGVIAAIVFAVIWYFGVFSVFLGREYGIIIAALIILLVGFGVTHYLDTDE